MSSSWKVERIAVDESDPNCFTALRLQSSFPLQGEMRHQLAALLPGLQGVLQKRRNLPMRRYLFLQMENLPRPGGAAALSRHASEWMPGLSVGVWPDREPPRSMRKEDFTHRLPGTPFAVPQGEGRQILATEENDLASVEADLAGSGALLEIFAPEEWTAKEGLAVSQWLSSRITDESYKFLPFYFPLLDAKALETLPASTLEHCLTGVELYLREDVENHGVLLITRLSFEQTMHLLDEASKSSP